MINKTRVAAAGLAASATVLVSIAMNEGYRDKAYQDSVGVWTIGFGETKNVKPGDTVTPQRAMKKLLESADAHAKGMVACIKVPIYQHEYDAYLSFTYNVGVGNFCKSDVARELNKGNYEQACKNLLHWDYAGGQKLKGLTRRRQEEYQLCSG